VKIFPAIDIKDKKCVRLIKGDFNNKTEYEMSPVKQAGKYKDHGFKNLHIVDLDGALTGETVNLDIIQEIVKKFDLKVEVGGGIRNSDSIQKYIDAGVEKVILGSAAIKDKSFLREACVKFPNKIALGLDAKDGYLSVSGWKENSNKLIIDYLKEVNDYGVSRIIYTDINRDGMKQSPNFSETSKVAEISNCPVIISGGVSSIDDIKRAKSLKNVEGIIVGKAIYDGDIQLEELVKEMLKNRIIPCLDVKNGRVVKGINFVDLKDAGDPVEQAKIYSDGGADEICFLDITASNENRDIIYDVVQKTSKKCFVPLTVGGGVRSVEDIHKLLNCGADKVSINTAAVENSKVVIDSSKKFGSQCIVVAIDAKKNGDKWEVFTHGGRKNSGIDVLEYAKQIEQNGAGELLITSMDRDGTQVGYDIDLISKISSIVNIPIIASGGVGNLDHLVDGIKLGKASAVLAASIFHYGKHSIKEAKDYLDLKGIPVRI